MELPIVTTIIVIGFIMLYYIERSRRKQEYFFDNVKEIEAKDHDDDDEPDANYKDPRDMTPDELRAFKETYRSDFTLVDYENWLRVHKDDPRNLSENHRNNLEKLVTCKGSIKLPKLIKPDNYGDEQDKQFKSPMRLCSVDPKDGMRKSKTLSEYNENKYNNFISPDKLETSWITKEVEDAKQAMEDSRELAYYIRPDVTTGDERTAIGDYYYLDSS